MGSLVLKKRDFSRDDTSFESLRKEGIRLIQELSGGVWTDYNLHDPGVTMLEHLCYGITDLVHRTGFPTVDYFTGEEGFVPEAVGMFSPEAILPCGPVTGDDLRKHLFDRLEGVENVWVEALFPGLWRILLRAAPGVDAAYLMAEATDVYHAVRNLGEDLLEVVVLTEDPYTLEAEMELDGSRSPSVVMAEIYHVCNGLLAPGIRPESHQAMLEEEVELATVFHGPLTRHGILSRLGRSSVVERVAVTEVIGAVRKVEGVVSVKKLCFFKGGLRHFVCIQRENKGSVLSLAIPGHDSDNRVALFLEGKRLAVDIDQFKGLYSALEFGGRRPVPHDPASLYTLPEATFRDFGEYTSIQDHFPNVYGINAFGVPPSYPEERKAAARQLKGYLALMEQFLADGMATLDAMPDLFSPEPAVRRTRFGRFLDSGHISGMDGLRTKKEPEAAHRALMKKYDAFHRRRNGFLTHLLALYGETVEKEPLRRDGSYFSDTALDEALIQVRIALLKRLPEISAHRFRGTRQGHRVEGERNIPPFQMKCEILLGFYHHKHDSLTQAITRDSLELVSDEHYLGLHAGTLAADLDADGSGHMAPISPAPKEPRLTCGAVRELMVSIVPFRHNLLFDSLLRGGGQLNRYRLVHLSDCDDVQIAFHMGDTWVYLGSTRTIWRAAHLVHLLRRYLMYINMATEGMHVVEHLLLRPRSFGTDPETPPDGFYVHGISILFPAWTDRFASDVFREITMEMVAGQLPVHLQPSFHFLSFDEMQHFETLWTRWQDAAAGGDESRRDELADALKTLLQSR
ncbi:hypothetical protein [Desulfoluna spongiiphila]|uniref:hypothetical protein n=1 Tax=Desulfoluna spongiiphila TaxID=419481 RepID=UPI00125AE801|nr:hypothetical protein [Desulfoluna spongiiphila]VVS95083.1 hypothetical protein DBB_46600 [Desulfoluna spongiiphila]